MSWVRVPPDSHMKKYKILKNFMWGTLSLEKGSNILIKEEDDGLSTVSVEHYPDKSQLIGTKAVEGMTLLQRIKACD